ncbi:hypothetical protein HOH45_00685 [bacterium]|nr:hypothetical protein [bacterium]
MNKIITISSARSPITGNMIQIIKKGWLEHMKTLDVSVGLYGADKMSIALATPPRLLRRPMLRELFGISPIMIRFTNVLLMPVFMKH